MLKIDTVLFATDFSPLANAALDDALALARTHGAVLHLLHAVVLHADDPNDPAHHFPDAEEIRVRLEEAADGRMTSQLAERNAGDIQVVRAQRRGISAAPAILEYADEIDADVIVMSTHGRRGLSHALLGSVTEEVVRLSARPVLTIRPREGSPAAAHLDNILVPVDFSRHSERAVAHALEFCRAYEARLHLLHVFEQPVMPEVYLGGSTMTDFSRVESSLREALTAVANRAGAGADTGIHVREGRAVAGILAAAAEIPADLIVIATHGLGGLTHVLLGSVTDKVLRRAECPVLTVKAFGRSLLG
ncbi:MAG: universal stress protein [Candidatus Palauibacterales bacterium]|jgi:nucleotide-binding universal stress UspA family protein|nr:universal stress protein [Candidatus Palauibacterales bacterium]